MPFDAATIGVIAQTLPAALNVSEAALATLAKDVDFRIRLVVQDAAKYMKHGKRSRLGVHDVNAALRLRNIQPLHGFKPQRCGKKERERKVEQLFSSVENMADVFFVDDQEVALQEIATMPPPPIPLDLNMKMHWLAVDGVQPSISQNAGNDEKAEVEEKEEEVVVGDGVEIRQKVRHELSRELHLFFEHVCTAVLGNDESHMQACLTSVESMGGVNQMLPYLSQFIYKTVTKNLRDLNVLFSCMRLTRAVVENESLNLESVLKQLLPAIVTCIVGRRLCADGRELHWELREFSVGIVQKLVKTYHHKYGNIKARFIKTLATALSQHQKALTTHYGCIVGLKYVGGEACEKQLKREMEKLAAKLDGFLSNAKRESIKRYEGLKVVAAILWAAGEDNVPTHIQKYVQEARDKLGKDVEPIVGRNEERTAERIRKGQHVSGI